MGRETEGSDRDKMVASAWLWHKLKYPTVYDNQRSPEVATGLMMTSTNASYVSAGQGASSLLFTSNLFSSSCVVFMDV